MSYVSGVKSLVNPLLFIDGKVLPTEADCKSVEFKISSKYVILQTDKDEFKNKVLNTLFTEGKMRCVCDYVLVTDNLVLVCEMKSGNEGDMKVQLSNTGKIIKYVLELIKQHHKIPSKIPPIKFVCFANIYKGFKQKSKGEKLDSIKWNGSDLFQLPCNSEYSLTQFL